MSTAPEVVPTTPPLRDGDRLTRAEFHRRYEAMPDVKKAELIEGVVYMPSPVSWKRHGRPHIHIGGWLAAYVSATPGTDAGDNATAILDDDNEPQPDAALIVSPEYGGRVTFDEHDYLVGPPDLIVEVSASRVRVDTGPRKAAYLRNGVTEYVIWRVDAPAVDWFVLRDGRYDPLTPDPADGLLKSVAFPGLWLDPAALTRRDLAAVLAALGRGLASPEHAAFVQFLASRRAAGNP